MSELKEKGKKKQWPVTQDSVKCDHWEGGKNCRRDKKDKTDDNTHGWKDVRRDAERWGTLVQWGWQTDSQSFFMKHHTLLSDYTLTICVCVCVCVCVWVNGYLKPTRVNPAHPLVWLVFLQQREREFERQQLNWLPPPPPTLSLALSREQTDESNSIFIGYSVQKSS